MSRILTRELHEAEQLLADLNPWSEESVAELPKFYREGKGIPAANALRRELTDFPLDLAVPDAVDYFDYDNWRRLH